jgi:SEC-C motif-containing protein
MDTQNPCPCGQPQAFEDCCGRFISGRDLPQSSEELMRSRYTAFATHQIEYLMASHHPETRGQADRDGVKRFSEGMTWCGLEILETVDGQAADDQGWVEFIARYREQGQDRVHHERSLFRRHQGRWFFHSAEHPKPAPSQRTQPKVGRNEPCPCGSGKKYKKCCAAKGEG